LICREDECSRDLDRHFTVLMLNECFEAVSEVTFVVNIEMNVRRNWESCGSHWRALKVNRRRSCQTLTTTSTSQ